MTFISDFCVFLLLSFFDFRKCFFLLSGYITSNVQKAINEFHSKTCVRFVNYNSGYHKNFIEFGNSKG